MENLGRVCGHCREFLSWDSFNLNKKGINGRKSICRVCTQDAANLLLQHRKENDPEFLKLRNRKKGLKSNHNLDPSSYNSLLESQQGKCAICKKGSDKHLFVDHCHATMRIRGLLCQHCNTLLGMAFDDTEILLGAIGYLNKQGLEDKS